MSKIVYIAEKQNVGTVMAEYLWGSAASKFKDKSGANLYRGKYKGDDVVVTWAQGHILRDAMPEEYDEKFADMFVYPVLPGLDSWELKTMPQTVKLLNTIKKEIKDADVVVNGGDPDREGQLLVDEILVYLGYDGPCQRIMIDGWDEKNVARAFNSIDDNDNDIHRNMYLAGLARKMADWLVGMNFSRAYSAAARKVGSREYLQVGRVKSWILGMLVRREREIKDFRPKKYFVLKGMFAKKGVPFNGTYVPDESVTDEEGRILEPQLSWLNSLVVKLKMQDGKVQNVKKKTGQKSYPPLPFSLDTLQVAASRKFGFSPQHVLDVTQQLYELKLLTYPRSDCSYIPSAQFGDAEEIFAVLDKFGIAQAKGADASIKSRAFNDKKITAHHAIIPTSVAPKDNLSKDQKKVYELVAQRYLQQFYPPMVYDSVSYEVLVGGESLFKGSGRMVTDPGWQKAFKDDAMAEDEENASSENSLKLPELTDGDVIPASDSGYEIIESMTKPPSRFNEASIIKAMTNVWRYVPKDAVISMGKVKQPLVEVLKECNGIGTPATRGQILEDLKRDYVQYTNKKGEKVKRPKPPYVVVEKKCLVPTEFGTQVVDSLFPLVLDTAMTAEMEFNLKRIADGDYTLEEYLDKITDFVNAGIMYAEEHPSQMAAAPGAAPHVVSDVDCPVCHKAKLRLAKLKSGAYVWVCSDKECLDKNGFNMYWGTMEEPAMVKCPECGRYLQAIPSKNGSNKWFCRHGEKEFSDKTLWLNDLDGKPDFDSKGKSGSNMVLSDVDCPVCHKAKLRLAKLKTGAQVWVCSDKDCIEKNGFVMYWGTAKKPTIEKCPECGRVLRAIRTKAGDEKWVCFHGKEGNMKEALWMDNVKGKPLLPAKCPTCGGYMHRVLTKNGLYKWVCDHGKQGTPLWLDDNNGKPVMDVKKCPECGRPMRKFKSSKTGNEGYVCDHGNKDGKPSFFDLDGNPFGAKKGKK